MKAQANLLSFLIRDSPTSLNSKSGNDATDDEKEVVLANILLMKEHQLMFKLA